MATRKRARPDHRHTNAEDRLRKDLDRASRTNEKLADANLAQAAEQVIEAGDKSRVSAAEFEHAIDRIVTGVVHRLNQQADRTSVDEHKMRLQHEHERQMLAAQQNRRSDAPLGSLAGTPTQRVPPPPVLSSGGTSGPGSVATSRPVSLYTALDQLGATVDCLEGQLGDTFRTVGTLLPPNFEMPEVPSNPISTSSEPVMRLMQLIERVERTRIRLSVITSGLTL